MHFLFPYKYNCFVSILRSIVFSSLWCFPFRSLYRKYGQKINLIISMQVSTCSRAKSTPCLKCGADPTFNVGCRPAQQRRAHTPCRFLEHLFGIRKSHATSFGHGMRRAKLEHLVTIIGMTEGKRGRVKQPEKMLDGIRNWVKVGQVTDALKVTRDRDVRKVMITYIKEHGIRLTTYLRFENSVPHIILYSLLLIISLSLFFSTKISVAMSLILVS